MRLLLVEDDDALAAAVSDALTRRGLSSDRAHGAADALLMLGAARYAAVLLDLGLPDGDGLGVLKTLRGRGDPIPVVVLTARGDVGDRIGALDAGADDYLIKPFDLDELLARLRAVLRRQSALQGSVLAVGNVAFDADVRELRVGGVVVPLSPREAELAGLLLRRAGRVVAKRLVEDQLFGLTGALGSNAVEVYVHRLRRRLEGAGAAIRIETIRGVGYLLAAA